MDGFLIIEFFKSNFVLLINFDSKTSFLFQKTFTGFLYFFNIFLLIFNFSSFVNWLLYSITICKNSSWNCFIKKVISILLLITPDDKPKNETAFAVKFWIYKNLFVKI